ncbi:hypothetical protein LA080_011834 [Diaporthe eres]|nr:hypothetical protein LA080_011834 [Diaporthe eres]
MLLFIAKPSDPMCFGIVLPLILHPDEKFVKLWKGLADAEPSWDLLQTQDHHSDNETAHGSTLCPPPRESPPPHTLFCVSFADTARWEEMTTCSYTADTALELQDWCSATLHLSSLGTPVAGLVGGHSTVVPQSSSHCTSFDTSRDNKTTTDPRSSPSGSSFENSENNEATDSKSLSLSSSFGTRDSYDLDRTNLDEFSLAGPNKALLTEPWQKEEHPPEHAQLFEVVAHRSIMTVGRTLRATILYLDLDATLFSKVLHPLSMKIRVSDADNDMACDSWLKGPVNIQSSHPAMEIDADGRRVLRFVFFAKSLQITQEGRYRLSYTVELSVLPRIHLAFFEMERISELEEKGYLRLRQVGYHTEIDLVM